MNRRGLLAMTGIATIAGIDPAAAKDTAPDRNAWPQLPENAIADGRSHTLAERFASVTAAQSAYPCAESLADELDWCALQAAIDSATAAGSGTVHVPNTGRAYVLNRPLRINPNRVSLRGDGSTLDFSRVRGEIGAIRLVADDAPTYGHERHAVSGFELIGPGRDVSLAGMWFRTATNGLSTRAQISDCAIHGFSTGLLFGDRAYAIGFSHVSVFDCGICVHAPAGLYDAGETISFSQCYLFNSGCTVANPGGFDLKFLACSLDYCGRLIADNNGMIDLVGCRLEIAPPAQAPIHCYGGQINMFGGFFLINGSAEAVHTSEIFALDNLQASIDLFGVKGWNWRTTSGKLSHGPGRIRWHEGVDITEAPASVRHP